LYQNNPQVLIARLPGGKSVHSRHFQDENVDEGGALTPRPVATYIPRMTDEEFKDRFQCACGQPGNSLHMNVGWQFAAVCEEKQLNLPTKPDKAEAFDPFAASSKRKDATDNIRASMTPPRNTGT